MVDYMMDVIRIEVLKNWYDNRPISNSRHISDTPTGTVFTDQRNLVSSADLAFMK